MKGTTRNAIPTDRSPRMRQEGLVPSSIVKAGQCMTITTAGTVKSIRIPFSTFKLRPLEQLVTNRSAVCKSKHSAPCGGKGKIGRSKASFDRQCPLVDPPGVFPLSQPDRRREGRWTWMHSTQALYALQLLGHRQERRISKRITKRIKSKRRDICWRPLFGSCGDRDDMGPTAARSRALSKGSSDAWETRPREHKHLWLTERPSADYNPLRI